MRDRRGGPALVVWLAVVIEIGCQCKQLSRPVILLRRRNMRNRLEGLFSVACQQPQNSEAHVLMHFSSRCWRRRNVMLEIGNRLLNRLLPVGVLSRSRVGQSHGLTVAGK